MKYNVFISYRREGGKDYARIIKPELKSRGLEVFLDFDELKDGKFDKRILDAIEEAPIFMIILSKGSLDRCVNEDDWVRQEVLHAEKHGKHIIPVEVDRTFRNIPDYIPDDIKQIVGQHQFSQIDTETLLQASINELVDNRIRPNLNTEEVEKKQNIRIENCAEIHIETDCNCSVYDFHKEIMHAIEGEDNVIYLKKGKHKLEFIHDDNEDIKIEKKIEITDIDYCDLIEITFAEELEKKHEEQKLLSSEEMFQQGEDLYNQGKYTEAIESYRKSAELGNAKAQFKLGRCFDRGEGVEQNYAEAVKWYKKSAEQGDADAQNSLGNCYEHGDGIEQNYKEAIKWYLKAVEKEHKLAQRNLGNLYYFGYGVEQNYAEAVKWYRKSAEQGDAEAQYVLGYMYTEEQGVEQNYAEAVIWYRKSAEQGNAYAQNDLGSCYYNGEGVEQNYEEAVKWYKKSAEQGVAGAQYNLGNRYYNGEGVEQDYTEAIKWYRMSAEQGDADAQNSLGVMYDNGQGVEQNYIEAVKWYRKSAEQGNAMAQYNLGILYENGYGVEQDKRKALEWYEKSAKQGYKYAKDRIILNKIIE